VPSRRLTDEEKKKADELLAHIREKVKELSGGDPGLLFAYTRKLHVKLMHDERGTPMQRRKLKLSKIKSQNGLCPLCKKPLPEKGNVLDRFEAQLGYTDENTRLLCQPCDQKVQESRGYS